MNVSDHGLKIDTLTQEVLTEQGISGTVEEWNAKVNIHDHTLDNSKYNSDGGDIKNPNVHLVFAVLNLCSCLYSIAILVLQSKK